MHEGDVVKLGVILKAHRRAETLMKVLHQLAVMGVVFDVRVVCLEDRPTDEVRHILATEPGLVRVPLKFSVVGSRERFMEANNVGLDFLEEWQPDWVYIADDDRWFEDGWAGELDEVLNDPKIDVAFVRSLFFWNETHVRRDFFHHCSPLLWRWRPGAGYRDDRMIETPPDLLDEARARGRVTVLRTRLMDFGYADRAEREHLARQYFIAGKVDRLTTALLDEEVDLVPYAEIEHDKTWPPGVA